MASEWIRHEVGNGLQALISLRLKNTPAEDMIELTADIWVQAFSRKVRIEEVDAPRIREGFHRIFPSIREWPAPIDVIELMPNRPPVALLPMPEPTEEEHRENVKRVNIMIDELKTKLFVKKKETPHDSRTDRRPLA